LTHKPERNSWATTPVIAFARKRVANCSASGATSSPIANVKIANTSPTLANIEIIRRIETPETRMTVYSELATIWASANKVPISAAMGNSS
jgi:hypothetical protein